MEPKKHVEILLPVKFRWILFSSFRGEVEKVSANQRPGWPSCFSDRPEKHKLGRRCWDLASCQVSLNSVQRFQRPRGEVENVKVYAERTDDGQTDDGRCAMTIAFGSGELKTISYAFHTSSSSSFSYWAGLIIEHFKLRRMAMAAKILCIYN